MTEVEKFVTDEAAFQAHERARAGITRDPAVGDDVIYCYASHDLDEEHQRLVGAHRPAKVVQCFSDAPQTVQESFDACYNLTVFTDALNDGKEALLMRAPSRRMSPSFDPKPGTFFYPPVRV